MFHNQNFDERQLVIRGKIGYRTTILALILILLSAIFTEEILHVFDLSDYLISLALIIITYFSVSLLWHDAYVGLYRSCNVNVLMSIFIALFMIQVLFLVFDIIQKGTILSGDLIMSYATLLFSGAVSFTFLWKKRQEHDE